MYMGRQTAHNLTSLIFDSKLVEPLPDLSSIPFGMVLITGNNEIISELSGVVELNNEAYVQEYKDYCVGKVRVTLICKGSVTEPCLLRLFPYPCV